MSRYYFFPTLVQPQPPGEKALFRFLKKMTVLGLQPFLTYPAVIKLRHKGEQRVSTLLRKRRILSAPCHRRRHILWLHKATGKWRPPSLLPGGRGLMAGMEAIPAAREKMVAGWTWIPVKSKMFSSFLSPPGILFLFIRHNCLFTGETNSPSFFFFFWRGLMESRFNYNIFLAM